MNGISFPRTASRMELYFHTIIILAIIMEVKTPRNSPKRSIGKAKETSQEQKSRNISLEYI
jgi:hypothetical protein